MNKRTVKLTESELHSIIKESVNTILSELNWRTYASAADKAYVRGAADIDRFRRGGDEYVNGKWRKKVSESQYSDEPFVLSGDYTEREKKKMEKKRKDSEKRKQNAEKNEKNKKAKEKKESDKLINQQRELYNYKDIFGN